MTALLDRRLPWVAAGLVVLLRLPFLGIPAGPDEGGFLTVAGQWHAAGSSLYGSYWVDRPPLLILLFQLADGLGGLVALRLLGALAAAATVLAVSATLRRVAGPGAAAAGAVTASALLVSPVFGATRVNGELLAAPFTAVGVLLACVALRRPGRLGLRAAVGTGASACAALLVKQNMAEVVVFAAVSWVLAWRTGGPTGRRLPALVGSAVLGAVGVLLAVTAWTVAHGTSPGAVFDAMYPFRLQAMKVLVGGGPADKSRLSLLVDSWLVSAVPLVMLVFLSLVLRRRARGPVTWAVLVTGAFSTASILLGASFWTHYLVELVVPVALALGLLVGVAPRLARGLSVLVVVSALVATAFGLTTSVRAPGTMIGEAIARSSHPADTVVTAFGDADMVRASGLSSPYPYLWSLPARVLDPHRSVLARVLAGPRAPTWLVVETKEAVHHVDGGATGPVVRRDYHRVADGCNRTVYLHDGLRRSPVRLHATCRVPGAAPLAQLWTDLG